MTKSYHRYHAFILQVHQPAPSPSWPLVLRDIDTGRQKMFETVEAFLGFMQDLLRVEPSQLAQAFTRRPNRSQAYFLQLWQEDASTTWQMALKRTRQAQIIL